MEKTIRKIHKYNLVFILCLAVIAVIIVLKLQGFPQIQFLVTLVLSFIYLGWALLYHKLDKTLTLEVMLEYILTALLAIVVSYGALL